MPAFASTQCFLVSDQGNGGSHIPVDKLDIFRNHSSVCSCASKFQFCCESKFQVFGKTMNSIEMT